MSFSLKNYYKKQKLINKILERENINFNFSQFKDKFKNKIILVTGGAGSIGFELCLNIIKYYDFKILIIIDNNEHSLYKLSILKEFQNKKIKLILSDIYDKSFLKKYIFQKYNINIIFHSAAYKQVPFLENQIKVAIKNNIKACVKLIDLAIKYKVSNFIYISSDKAVNPTNIMGATKRIIELYILSLQSYKSLKTKFTITRFGNVLGSKGSILPLFLQQIKDKKDITLTSEKITRYFMTLQESSLLLISSYFYTKNNFNIFILDMGDEIKIIDIIKRLINIYQKKSKYEIKIKVTELRQGEKLYEELYYKSEDFQKTDFNKLMQIKKVPQINNLEFTKDFKKLLKLKNKETLFKIIKKYV